MIKDCSEHNTMRKKHVGKKNDVIVQQTFLVGMPNTYIEGGGYHDSVK